MMAALRSRVLTHLRLGIGNLAVVGIYRTALRFGLFERCCPEAESYRTALFTLSHLSDDELRPVNDILVTADALFDGRVRFFSHKEYAIGSPPDWFFNPFSETRLSDSALHWSRIGDFKTGSGDIKG
ncbi:MAG: hypothetical protein GY801_36530, partial [bacterium]|nr:hypothetical protein [bacterium]